MSTCVLRSPAHYFISELSVLATKWNNGKARSPFDHSLDNRQDGDDVHALVEGMKHALDEFQVSVEWNFRRTCN